MPHPNTPTRPHLVLFNLSRGRSGQAKPALNLIGASFRGLRSVFLPVLLFMALLGAFRQTSLTPAQAEEASPVCGTLVLVGGALEANHPEIFEAVKQCLNPVAQPLGGTNSAGSAYTGRAYAGRPYAGRTRPRIALIPTSKENLAAARADFYHDDPDEPEISPGYRKWLIQAGFEPVLIPLAPDTVFGPQRAAENQAIASLIRSCQVVFLLGGDQARHAICLRHPDGSDTPALRAIRQVYADGGVIMGTSAGTHVLADPMYGWGESGPTLQAGKVEPKTIRELIPDAKFTTAFPDNSIFMPGLGFLPTGMLSDTHFDARGRLGRLLVGIRDTHATLGIGVDETTALFFKNGIGTAVGQHGVFVVDAGSATFSEPGVPFTGQNLRVSYLTAGDRWDSATGLITSTRPKLIPSPSAPDISQDLFSHLRDAKENRKNPYETTKVMQQLAKSMAVTCRAYSAPPQVFQVRFRKTAQTAAYGLGSSPATIDSLAMDIEPGD